MRQWGKAGCAPTCLLCMRKRKARAMHADCWRAAGWGPACYPLPFSLACTPLRAKPPLACFLCKEREICTFEEEVGLGQVQLVPKGDTCVLHPCAGLELHTHLQLEGPGQHTRVSLLGWTLRHASPGHPIPRQPVPRWAHLVTGFVVIRCMHACLTQCYCRQPVVHWKRAGGLPRGLGQPRAQVLPLFPQTQESSPQPLLP